MLSEALTTLATAGGTAVVQAAGTDVWTSFRVRLARIFGTGGDVHPATLERLDRSAAALEDVDESGQACARVEAAWTSRLEDLLDALHGEEERAAAEQLSALISEVQQQLGASSLKNDGLVIGGDSEIHATDNSVAAGVIQGDVRLENPSGPGQ